MIDVRFRPLDAPPYRSRKSASFRAGWNDTLDKLEKELSSLGARDIVVQAGFTLADVRNDGWPRGGRRPSHPAVVLTFRDKSGNSLSFPCDTYNDHEDNLRAIALSLEALRAVNRYGVTKGHEQYKGFAQLPAANPNSIRNAALLFFSQTTGWTNSQIVSDPNGAYRLASRACHPDLGGNQEVFVKLQEHWKVLQGGG